MKKVKVYLKGEEVTWTGKIEEIYGGVFYEVRVLTGYQKNKLLSITKENYERQVADLPYTNNFATD